MTARTDDGVEENLEARPVVQGGSRGIRRVTRAMASKARRSTPTRLPRLPAHSRHGVEVFVAAHDGQTVLQRQGGDPGIVGGNGASRFL